MKTKTSTPLKSVSTEQNNAVTQTDTASAAAVKSTVDAPEAILVERRERVGIITLHRPKSLNALNRQLAREV
ncbi:MAG: enoyl-CoA hydratase, partial [Motiliproteus sp.]